jgi:hypothetical protein
VGAALSPKTLATLRLDGVAVAECVDGAHLPAELAPRPYLHPVRTLAGTVVTDAGPEDHPWHLGLSVAVQDVDGWNFWGGPTFVRGQGYVRRRDHGRVEHVQFEAVDSCAFTHLLRWRSWRGETVLTERRRVDAQLSGQGWELRMTTSLTNATDRPVRLGSPATNGRPGAGYGGLFWRMAPGGRPRVFAEAGSGEDAVHGSAAPWVAWADEGLDFTIVLSAGDDVTPVDPWFVRVREYPGVGLQVAARDPVTLAVREEMRRTLRALITDGASSP